jgi:hypothetical protein
MSNEAKMGSFFTRKKHYCWLGFQSFEVWSFRHLGVNQGEVERS